VADYPKRPDEMLKELDAIKSVLPEQAVKNFADAIARYRPWRRGALEELLRILEDDDDDEQARTWTDRCERFRAEAPDHFENALNNIQLPTEAAAAGYRWQLALMANEARFFETLGKVNAAQVRDYLCANRESLRTYTDALDQKWRAIVDEGNKLQADEKKVYDEMMATTRRIVDELTQADRTLKEKMGYAGTFPLLAIEKLGGTAADLIGLPDGVGEAAEKAAEYAREKMQAWLEANRALQGRAANYRALLQAEKGGVLPLFRETRRQVYEYWEKNNPERARDWLNRFRQSLESEWVASCPTCGQQDDAKDFYKAGLERVEKHFKAVEEVAKRFEEKWTGVFKGPLAPRTIDELVDSQSWRVNAETLVSIRTPEVVNKLLDQLDGYYEESLEQPLGKLKDKADDLPEGARQQAVQAVDRAKKRVEESIRARLVQYRNEIGASLRWFESDEIRKTLDRSALEDDLD
jgi:hypothetical protein